MVAGLGQDLDDDVVGNQVFFDQFADEVEVRLRGRWEADLNLPCSPYRPVVETCASCVRATSDRSAPDCRRAGQLRTSAVP